MLLVICNIIGKIHAFELCNLNHTFSFQSHISLHIPHKLFETEKSLGSTVLLCVCVCVCFLEKISYLRKVQQQGNFLVPFKTFSENSHGHYLASDISILFLNLFKKIVLASQRARVSRMVRKAFLHYLSRSFIVQRNILSDYISIILC